MDKFPARASRDGRQGKDKRSPSKRGDSESGAVAWLWEYLKWYTDYADVAFFKNLTKNLDYNDYFFISVGKSDDDTESHGGFWDNPFGMCLVRGIVFD